MGKTALLEALRLYAHRGTVSVIGEVLIARQEIGYRRPRGSYDDMSYQAEALSYLFHGYKHISDISEPIVIRSSRFK